MAYRDRKGSSPDSRWFRYDTFVKVRFYSYVYVCVNVCGGVYEWACEYVEYMDSDIKEGPQSGQMNSHVLHCTHLTYSSCQYSHQFTHSNKRPTNEKIYIANGNRIRFDKVMTI